MADQWPPGAEVVRMMKEWCMPPDSEGKCIQWMQHLASNTRFTLGAMVKVVLQGVEGTMVFQTGPEGISQYNFNEQFRGSGIMPAEPDWFHWHSFWHPGLELLNVYDLNSGTGDILGRILWYVFFVN